jgi:hypothetical protein
VTPDEHRQWSKIGADISWARTPDRTKRTDPGREGLNARFEREVREMHGDLPPDAHAKCVESLRRAYFRRMALIGVQTKAAKKAAAKTKTQAAEA